jgi:Spy/CpxP family protein refolding chaperone
LTSCARWKALLLIGVLIAIVAPIGGAAPAGGGSRPLPEELNLSVPQRERLDALSARIRGTNRDLGRRLEGRRRELNGLYNRFEMDDLRARRLRQEIHEIQGQMLEVHHTFQIELRKILTAAQFSRLQEARRTRRGPPDGRGRRSFGPAAPAVPAAGERSGSA